MTPRQVTAIDAKELKEIEMKCDCGASLRFPLPLQTELRQELACLGCKRPLWGYGSEVRGRIAGVLSSLDEWQSFPQAKDHSVQLSFIVSEQL